MILSTTCNEYLLCVFVQSNQMFKLNKYGRTWIRYHEVNRIKTELWLLCRVAPDRMWLRYHCNDLVARVCCVYVGEISD